jgi:hypothetical protein
MSNSVNRLEGEGWRRGRRVEQGPGVQTTLTRLSNSAQWFREDGGWRVEGGGEKNTIIGEGNIKQTF